MNKDIELSLAALLLAFVSVANGCDALTAVVNGDWAAAIWKGVSCAGAALLTRAVWRAA